MYVQVVLREVQAFFFFRRQCFVVHLISTGRLAMQRSYKLEFVRKVRIVLVINSSQDRLPACEYLSIRSCRKVSASASNVNSVFQKEGWATTTRETIMSESGARGACVPLRPRAKSRKAGRVAKRHLVSGFFSCRSWK